MVSLFVYILCVCVYLEQGTPSSPNVAIGPLGTDDTFEGIVQLRGLAVDQGLLAREVAIVEIIH